MSKQNEIINTIRGLSDAELADMIVYGEKHDPNGAILKGLISERGMREVRLTPKGRSNVVELALVGADWMLEEGYSADQVLEAAPILINGAVEYLAKKAV